MTQLIDVLTDAAGRGPVSSFNAGGHEILLVTGPSAVQHVLATRAGSYVRRSSRMRFLLGDGVIPSSVNGGDIGAEYCNPISPRAASPGTSSADSSTRAVLGAWIRPSLPSRPSTLSASLCLLSSTVTRTTSAARRDRPE
jgi:hypothetical protein